MQKFHLALEPHNAIGNYLVSFYNRWMNRLALKSAENMCKSKNKAIYGIEMYNCIHVMTSNERDDINKSAQKGNKMNIASMLKYQTFRITPEGSRGKVIRMKNKYKK